MKVAELSDGKSVKAFRQAGQQNLDPLNHQVVSPVRNRIRSNADSSSGCECPRAEQELPSIHPLQVFKFSIVLAGLLPERTQIVRS